MFCRSITEVSISSTVFFQKQDPRHNHKINPNMSIQDHENKPTLKNKPVSFCKYSYLPKHYSNKYVLKQDKTKTVCV